MSLRRKRSLHKIPNPERFEYGALLNVRGGNAMSVLSAVQIVESFWSDVWVARNPGAVDRYVVED